MNKNEVKAFFDSHADCWDENMICDEIKINKILDFAGITENISVLDVACGTGILFDFYLRRKVKNITGVDISPKMAEIAKSKYKNYSDIDILCADAETYRFEKEYDCCVVFNAFPHFPNPDMLIENLYRALKDGGTLTIAHDRGRKALDIHHSGEASKISCGLICEKELGKKLERIGFADVETLANDGIYIVKGKKSACC